MAEIKQKFINKIKELNIKVDFSHYKSEINENIKKQEARLEEILRLEKDIL